MSIIGVGLAGMFINTVTTIVEGTLPQVKGGTLITPMSAGASCTRSSFISEVTTRALDIEVPIAS